MTPAQQTILEYLRKREAAKDYAPTFREIAADLGYESWSTVHSHCVALREQGKITWEDGKPRTLRTL